MRIWDIIVMCANLTGQLMFLKMVQIFEQLYSSNKNAFQSMRTIRVTHRSQKKFTIEKDWPWPSSDLDLQVTLTFKYVLVEYKYIQ